MIEIRDGGTLPDTPGVSTIEINGVKYILTEISRYGWETIRIYKDEREFYGVYSIPALTIPRDSITFNFSTPPEPTPPAVISV